MNYKEATTTTVEGIYLRTQYHNVGTGRTVFDIRSTDNELIHCVGVIMPPKAKILVSVTGKQFDTNSGKQMRYCTLTEKLNDPRSLKQFLKCVPYIGEVFAEKIVQALDEDILTFSHRDDALEYLTEHVGIPRNSAESLLEYVKTNQTKTALFSLLSRFGDTAYSLTMRMLADYGKDALKVLVRDPYTVGMRYGLEFATCDALAKMLSLPVDDDPKRIQAAAKSRIEALMANGDCCIPIHIVTDEVCELLVNPAKQSGTVGVTSWMVANAILSNDKELIVEGENVYTREGYWQEIRTASALRRLIRTGVKADYDPNELCEYAEAICGVKYAVQQRAAFAAFLKGGICVLTGGPGTGKTTVVRGLLTAYEKLFPGKVIKLCAPTGRASQRMKEATGREASTIHRLLEYTPYGDSFSCKNEHDPIDADLIVVDESSMISIDIAALFFSAIKSGTTVLLVGDTDQLPSVGPGMVLGDIISSGTVPVYALTETYRQGSDSPIITNAQLISAGNHNLVRHKDFAIVQCIDETVAGSVINMYLQYHDPNDPFRVQILAPTKSSETTGTNIINKFIQNEVIKQKTGGVRYKKTVFYVGDKIMMTRNNYNVGYFNGDIGIIKHFNSNEVVVAINGEDVHVPIAMLEDMTLAYATTIHKSQGSEYEVVIIIMPDTPVNMLQRNILYTAVTRARKRVVLVSNDHAIFSSVNTVTSTRRYTMLRQRLCAKNIRTITSETREPEAPRKEKKPAWKYKVS